MDCPQCQEKVWQHTADQVVVATESLNQILPMLSQPPSEITSDPRLGLTLLTLSNVAGMAKDIRDHSGSWVTRLASATASRTSRILRRPASGPCDLTLVMDDIRSRCARRYGGWCPTIGKNRVMTGVQFSPYPNAELPPVHSLGEPVPFQGVDAQALLGNGANSSDNGGARVGLLDTRLYQHQRLAGRYIAAQEALIPTYPPSSTDPSYIEGHAAFVSSLILREAPATQLLVRLAAQNGGPSISETYVWDVAGKLVRYADSGIHILNCSWACYTMDGKAPFVLEQAVRLLGPDILVVAAAGNHGQNTAGTPATLPAPDAPSYPAALDKIVAVGALGLDGQPADFNPRVRVEASVKDGPNAGSPLAPWVDLLAPGVDVCGAYFGDNSADGERVQLPRGGNGPRSGVFRGVARWSGTSFAAGTVTGALAGRMSQNRTAQDALAELRQRYDPRIRPAHP